MKAITLTRLKFPPAS